MSANLSGTQKAGAALAALTVGVPGLMVSGFMFPVSSTIGVAVLLGVSLVGGALSGMLLAWRHHRWLGLAAGMIGGPGGFLATAGWCMLRDSVLNLEIALTMFVGALPGLLVYAVGARLLKN